MTLDEIKAAVNAGTKVFWKNHGYQVVRRDDDQWFIVWQPHGYHGPGAGNAIGLTWTDGVTLNGEPADFFAERLSAITGTMHDDKCEECNEPFTHETMVEGHLGFYCSQTCHDIAEDRPSMSYREDFHADG